jgi:hypothetical protein
MREKETEVDRLREAREGRRKQKEPQPPTPDTPAAPALTDADVDAEIVRLAKLSGVRYERERAAAVKRLDLRATVLDRMVAAERGKNKPNDGQGQPVSFPEPEPSVEEVDGAKMLDEIATAVSDHVVMSNHARDLCALWVVYSYLVDCFLIAPRLAIRSATPLRNPPHPVTWYPKSVTCRRGAPSDLKILERDLAARAPRRSCHRSGLARL